MPSLLHAALAGTILLSSAAPAAAALIPFNATRTNSGPVVPIAGGPCAPGLTLPFLPGAPTFNQGTSNLGDFAATINECPVGPPPAPNANSPWLFEFDNGTLFGTKFGNPTGPIAGGFGFVSTFTILGGTGFFAGATGGFTGVGDVVFARSPLAIETLTGSVDIDVPEPAAITLFGLGTLAFAGAMQVRRRRSATSG